MAWRGIGIFLGALLIASWGAWNKVTEINRYQEQLEAGSVLNAVAGKIDTVWLEGVGFSTNVTIPQTIMGRDYTLNKSSNFIFIVIGENEYSKPIITKNVTGDFTLGSVNTISNMADHVRVS